MSMFNKAAFRLPNRSKFSEPFSYKGSTGFGKLRVAKFIDVVPGMSVNVGLNALCRFAPLLAPCFHRFNMQVDAFFVPYRILDPQGQFFHSERFFNMQTDDEVRGSIPAVPNDEYGYLCNGVFSSSLLDDFNYYDLSDVFDFSKWTTDPVGSAQYPSSLLFNGFASYNFVNVSVYDTVGQYFFWNELRMPSWSISESTAYTFNWTQYTSKGKLKIDRPIPTYYNWLHFCNGEFNIVVSGSSTAPTSLPSVYFDGTNINSSNPTALSSHSWHSFDTPVTLLDSVFKSGLDLTEATGGIYLYFVVRNGSYTFIAPSYFMHITGSGSSKYVVDSSSYVLTKMFGSLINGSGFVDHFGVEYADSANSDSLLNQYDDYLKSLLSSSFASGMISLSHSLESSIPSKQSLLPILAYWRCVRDWYINPNLINPSEFYGDDETSSPLADGSLLSDFRTALANDTDTDWQAVQSDGWLTPFMRLYPNDYFTSCNPSPQSGSAVAIPANGTIADLRSANSLQQALERAMYGGNRYIDQVLAFFGVKSKNARSDYSIPLGRVNVTLGVQDVMQTSQSTLESSLGEYAGMAVGAKGDHLFSYTADEHGCFLILYSVMPSAEYMSCMPRHLLKTDFYDFLIPDFAQIGDQPVYNVELSPLAANPLGVFGYQRRYAEYMWMQDEVHGSFRTSMDYWHDARKFDSEPSLDKEFLQVSDSDDLNRIFAVTSDDDNCFVYMRFNCDVVAPLSRYISYDL